MITIENFKHKDCWTRRGENFNVEITRHEEEPMDSDGKNRWCVYAYIFRGHPHFEKFSGDRLWQDAASEMPLHGGASLLRYMGDGKKVTTVKVGADYRHDGDDFTHMEKPEEVPQVFRDAENLYNWLSAREVQS